ncbi:MAG TPA: chaperone NapD [Azonexus sp.]|uniref:Chaperone NapD n=1 Tax=Dechloromonas hankyongensis TaxID=2908002 RepID=A0ABS9K006_9RHOO|nr:chaperone NapD [Dechloromonas hankyongensis]MCG2576493.1 chaperone NapD [Dechloromonas hankyongensis]HLO62551.1 chaperone NapD [Azonexus sp.]
MNISSAILHIAPTRLAEARDALLALSGVEIHAETPEGKMVVVLEDDDLESAANKYVALHGVPGVATVAMVYQYSDDESVETEEVQA